LSCGGDKLEEVPLSRRGTVHTFFVNYTMPAPFVAPLPIAVVDLEDGARVMLQVVGAGEGLRVGTPVELVLRRYAVERGAPVYGFKALTLRQRPGREARAAPATDESEGVGF
jgi:hydroxymethylglutaryl-CoA synthase